MINGLEGIPGSGKSYEAVAMHVMPALNAGRRVITNLPLIVLMFESLNPAFSGLIELRTKSQPVVGTWDAEGIDSKGNGQAFKPFSSGYVADPVSNVPVFGSVWDYYSDWKHPLSGLGPLFIVDEAHLALPKLGTNQQVVEWFKLHRHFNADVLLATQSFRDINQPIAGLLAILIKCRKADILGKSGSYIRKVHAGFRGAEISKEVRKYEPHFFKFYRSHTQGNSVGEALASDVSPLSVKLRRVTWFWWALTIAFAIWAFWPKSKNVRSAAVAPAAVASKSSASAPQGAAVLPVAPLPSAALPASAPVVDLEPLRDKLVHITGSMRNAAGLSYTFAVSAQGLTQFAVVSADLLSAGYTYQPMGNCMGYLKWGAKVRTVTCDAPVMAVGSNNAPVVMDAGTGRTSEDARKNRASL